MRNFCDEEGELEEVEKTIFIIFEIASQLNGSLMKLPFKSHDSYLAGTAGEVGQLAR